MRFITSFMLILIHVYCMMMCIVNHLSNIIITMESFGQYFDSAFFDSYSSCLDTSKLLKKTKRMRNDLLNSMLLYFKCSYIV